MSQIEESKVSVIIPVYNSKKYIDRCLKSVVNQSYKNIEILLMIKQGDDSTEICIEWQKKDWRIIIVSRQDDGLGDARNYALRIAKGKYIAYVDADDWIDENYIKKLVMPLEEYPEVEISCCGFDRNETGGIVTDGWIPKNEGVTKNGRWSTWVTVWLRMYRIDFLREKDILFFSGSHEDDAFYWNIKAYVKYVYFIPEILYHYTQDNVQSLMHISNQRILYFTAMSFALDRMLLRDGKIRWQGWMLHEIISCIPYKIFDLGEDRDKGRLLAGQFLRKYFPIDEIVLFGAGNDAKDFLIRHYEVKVKYIIDNDINKRGSKLNGIEIKTFDEVINENALIVVSSSKYCKAIESQLLEADCTYYLSLDEYQWICREYMVYR